MDLTKKWVIAFDTMCDGWQCIQEGDGQPCFWDSEAEAQKEIDEDPTFYDSGDFPVRADEYIHGRKAIWNEMGGHIAGQKLDPNGRIQDE